jgi:hypothetical protein
MSALSAFLLFAATHRSPADGIRASRHSGLLLPGDPPPAWLAAPGCRFCEQAVWRFFAAGVGTTYLNTSTFLGRTTQLTYVVDKLADLQLNRLRGENKTLIAVDTLTFRPAASGTEVTCTAEFTFKGLSRIAVPLLKPAFERLGNEAEAGLRKALNRL